MFMWSQMQCLTRALGYPPSHRELCAAAGISLNALWFHVKLLRDAGLLEPSGHNDARTFVTRYRLEALP
jgi:biotin operon repressor